VIDFKELCQVLEVPEVEPYMVLPSPTGQPADIHTFLSSPSSNSKRWVTTVKPLKCESNIMISSTVLSFIGQGGFSSVQSLPSV
jgi:hypothetical protein